MNIALHQAAVSGQGGDSEGADKVCKELDVAKATLSQREEEILSLKGDLKACLCLEFVKC